MKFAAIFAAAVAIAAPASADVLLGAGCGGSQTLVTAGAAKGGTQLVIVRGSACEGPRREVVHTLEPGKPVSTTIIVRRGAGETSGNQKVVRVGDRRADFGGSSQARVVRVGN